MTLLTKQVRYAAANDIPFLATGGGHGYTTSYGALQSGLKVDLSFFDQTDVDADQNTVTVGGSVTFEQVTEQVYQAGREIREIITI